MTSSSVKDAAPLRLLLVQNMIYWPSFGGANKANRLLLEGLAARGHHCVALTPALGSHGPQSLGELQSGLTSEGVTVDSTQEGVLRYRQRGVMVESVVEGLKQPEWVSRVVRRVSPDIVLVSSEDPGQMLLGAALDALPGRVVYIVHTPLYLPFGPEAYVSSERGSERVRRAAEVVTVSGWVQRYLQRYGECSSRVLRFPVYGSPPFPSLGRFARGAVTLVNPCAYKGLPIFLELARRFPEVPFLGVETWGTTPEDRRALTSLPNVRLRGPAEDIDEIFAETRLLLMPSLFLEAFGLLAVEAMLRGIPVVASDSGGLPEAKLGIDYVLPVRTIERYLNQLDARHYPKAEVPSQEIGPWERALTALLRNEEHYRDISQRSRRAAELFLDGVGIEPFETMLLEVAKRARELPAPAISDPAPSATPGPGSGAKAAETLSSNELRERLAMRLLEQNRAQRRGEAEAPDPPSREVDAPIERLPRSPGRQRFEPSFAQQRLWFLDQLDPQSPIYNVATLSWLRGEIDGDRLRSALAEVVRGQEVLRTGLVMDDRSTSPRLVQEVLPSLELPWSRIDATLLQLSANRRDEWIEELARRFARRPFELRRPPLFRLLLVRVAERLHALVAVFHHAICDGLSAQLFLQQLAQAYAGSASQLAAPALHYADYAHWERRRLENPDVLRPRLEAWEQRLRGAPRLELPERSDSRPSQARGRRLRWRWSGEVIDAVDALAKRQRVSPFMLFLALFQLALFRLTGQGDLVVGTPIAGRTRRQWEQVLGLFVNTLPIRTELRGELSFHQVLELVRAAVLEAHRYQDLPLDRLVEHLRPQREGSRNPLFPALFIFPPPASRVPLHDDLEVEEVPFSTGVALLELALEVRLGEDDGEAWLTYEVGRFEATAMLRLGSMIRRLADQVIRRPELEVRRHSVLSLAQRQQLMVEWNDTERKVESPPHLLHRFWHWARRSPETPALRSGENEWSYGELAAECSLLAAALRYRLAQREPVGHRGHLVAVYLDRGPGLIPALYAVLSAGAAYLPLESDLPQERLELLLRDASPALVITDAEGASVLASEPSVLTLDQLREEGRQLSAPAIDEGSLPRDGGDHLAYVIYTSGSTGKPKAVACTHRGIVNRLRWMQREYPLNSREASLGDRVLQKTPIGFDVSVWELFWPLSEGALLVMAEPGGHRDPSYLWKTIAAEEITTLHFVPSMLRAFLAEPRGRSLHGLRQVMVSGEALTPDLAALFHRRLPGVALHNLYGPTEASVDVSFWPCRPQRGSRPVPIGRPIDNLRLSVRDRLGTLAPLGSTGELWLAGVGLARGYLGSPRQTAERFVPDPTSRHSGGRCYRTGDLARWRWDGSVEYLGRLDHQVKIRGMRIELGEIEAQLRRLDAVDDAVVTVVHGAGDSALVAYLATPGGDEVRESRLENWRLALRRRLPTAMVPRDWVLLDELPQLANGKVDRKALPAPDARKSRGEAPAAGLEERIAALWRPALGLSFLAREANLFDLGAHSLMAAQVRVSMERELGISVPLKVILEAPSIAALAHRLESSTAPSAFPPLEAAPGSKSAVHPLTFAQQRLWFLARWQQQAAAFHMAARLDLQGELDAPRWSEALRVVAWRQSSLRTTFREIEGQGHQQINEEVHLPIVWVDLSGLPLVTRFRVADELAQRRVRRPLDLASKPPWRVMFLRLAAQRHQLVLVLHHLLADAWSIEVLARELMSAYERVGSERREVPLPLQISDVAHWQRSWLQGSTLDSEIDFFRQQLSDAPASLDLPFDRPPSPHPRRRASRVVRQLIPSELQALTRRAGEVSATLFIALLAGWKLMLRKVSGSDDLVVGTLVANRHHPGTEDLVGCLINTLAVRSSIPGAASVAQALQEVRESTLATFAHQDTPFELVVEALDPPRDVHVPPFFQTLIVLQNAPTPTLHLDKMQVSGERLHQEALHLDLYLTLEPTDSGLRCQLDYSEERFEVSTATRLLEGFLRVVRGIASESSERRVSSLSWLDEKERRQLLVEWGTGPGPAVLPADSSIGVVERFTEWARRDPDALAVSGVGAPWTYGELFNAVSRISTTLEAAGVGEDEVVPVLGPRGPLLVSSLLSLWRCGAAALPLDPAHPPKRWRKMLDGRPLRYVLQWGPKVSFPLPAVVPIHVEDSLAPETERIREGALESPVPAVPKTATKTWSADRLAYVLFTSGSTGQPKGAMVAHGGMLRHLLAKISDLDLDGESVVAQNASQSFDVSVWQMVAALMVGGRVEVCEDAVAYDAAALLQRCAAAGVTVLEVVPSMLEMMLQELERVEAEKRVPLTSLRWLIPTGEALPPTACRRWLKLLPQVPLLNAYGPTECSDDVSHHAVIEGDSLPGGTVSIGRPIAGSRLIVVDQDGDTAGLGVSGELMIGGAGVGRGYWEAPQRTALIFRPDPFTEQPGSRIYRTGDRARWTRDGRLQFLGRVDHQVKLRGFRIEVGEVEAALLSCPGVAAAVVALRPAAGPQARLVAWVSPRTDQAIDALQLRRTLAELLPEAMVPSAIVVLEALPLSSTGKVDRSALPDPLIEQASAPPQSEVERALAQIWGELLELPVVSREQDFFELGGHSLLAPRLIARVGSLLGVHLELRDLFSSPRLMDLAAKVESLLAGSSGAETQLRSDESASDEALSFAQRRMWFLAQLAPTSAAYNLPQAVTLGGDLRVSSLARALEIIESRHEALRTAVVDSGGEPAAKVADSSGRSLPVVDLSALDAARAAATARQLAVRDAQQPFDLATGPLLRTTLLRVAAEEHVLLLNLHHIIGDGWSLAVLLAEVGALYPALAAGRPAELPPLAVQYRHFAQWQQQRLQEARLQRSLEHWRRVLGDAPASLDLPRRRRRSAVSSERGHSLPLHWPRELADSVHGFARRHGATLFMVLNSAFFLLLARLTQSRDLSVGVPVAGRPDPSLEPLIGLFVNTVVLRCGIPWSQDSESLLAHVREVTLDALAHQEVPFDHVVTELNPVRDLDRSPLFEVMFALQNAPVETVELPGLEMKPLVVESGVTRFELFLEMREHDGVLEGTLHYARELYEEDLMQRTLGYYRRLVEGMLEDSQRPLANISWLSESETQELLLHSRGSQPPLPIELSFDALWRNQLPEHRHRVAVAQGVESLSYGALDRQVDALSRRLWTIFGNEGEGVGESRVAILANRGVDLLVGMLAVLRGGGAFLNLDPLHPAHRNAQILASVAPCHLLVASDLEMVVEELEHELSSLGLRPEEVLLLPLEEHRWPDSGSLGSGPSAARRQPPSMGGDRLAYILHTSGSTGTPKGAMISHRGMVNHLWAKVQDLGLDSRDVVAQCASQSFDISIWQQLAPLVVGGRVEIYEDEIVRDPQRLLEQVEEDGVTVLEIVPTLLDMLLELLENGGLRPPLDALRWLMLTGEALPGELCRRWATLYPDVRLINAYGPTECSDDVSHGELRDLDSDVDPATDVATLGRPVIHTRLHVTDPRGGLVPRGVAGELWVGGVGVGRGYWRNPVRTAESFVPDPYSRQPGQRLYRTGDLVLQRADYRLDFLGRLDHQVKVRGFRLELGEIEARLRELPGVRAAAVLAIPDGTGSNQLRAFVATGREVSQAEDGEVGVKSLQAELSRQLPGYAIPSAWKLLPKLPLAPSGKIDRKALEALEVDAAAASGVFVEPRDELELAVSEIFAELTGRDRVGAMDDFFALGGHSLLATQMVSRLRDRFAVPLTLRSVFEFSTVEEVARVVEDLLIEQIEELSDDELDALLDDGGEGASAELTAVEGDDEPTRRAG